MPSPFRRCPEREGVWERGGATSRSPACPRECVDVKVRSPWGGGPVGGGTEEPACRRFWMDDGRGAPLGTRLPDSSGRTRVRPPRGPLRRKGFQGPLIGPTQGLLRRSPQPPAGRLVGEGRRKAIPATGVEKRGRHRRKRRTERQGRKQRASRHDGEGKSRKEK